MKKVSQLLNRCNRQKESCLSKGGQTVMSFRKARTITLIQLGGLVVKSGLLEALELKVGDDLQRDESCLEGAAILMGGLGELRRMLESEDATGQRLIWAETGKKILGE